MTISRLLPKAIGSIMAVTAAITVAGMLGWREPGQQALWIGAMRLGSGLACVVGLALCARIAGDYARGTWMRRSWLLLAGSAAASVLRYWMEALLIAGPDGWRYLLEWRQVPSVLSLLLLVAGLLAMWRSLISLGLGFAATSSDWVLLVMIAALVPITVSFREGLSEWNSPHVLVRALQFSSPLLVAMLAGVTIPLHRLSCEMQGGQIARSLRWLLLFAVLRAVLFVRIIPAVAALPWALTVHAVLTNTMQWLFALAVVYRWQLTAEALSGRRESLVPCRYSAG